MKKKGLVIIIIIAAICLFIALKIGKKIDRGTVKQKGEAGQEIAYYTCGMHPDVKSDKPGMCPICNMPLVPVYKEESQQAAAGQKKSQISKIIYYRNPMDPSITSPVPMKDSMGMDFIPVYSAPEVEQKEEVYYGCGMIDGSCPGCDKEGVDEGCICGEHTFTIKGVRENCPICAAPLRELSKDEADKLKGVVSRVKIKKEQLVLAGVETQAVKKQHLFKEIRTVGKVAYDPDLAIAQEEYLSALKSRRKIENTLVLEIKERAESLFKSAKRKLKLLGMSDEQIKKLELKGEIQSSLILPEEEMWIYGDVYEYELSWVKIGEKVLVTTQAFPGEEFEGVIVSVNPVIDSRKRTLRFRAQVDNSGLKLKPEMYVDIMIQSMYRDAKGETEVLAIAKEAVLDTGRRRIVWLDKGKGNYEGRIIHIGPLATAVIDGEKVAFYPVLKGLNPGEVVVTKANFLIDSQSQLSGVAVSIYGGALGGAEEELISPVGYQH
ncbi:MAG TPA: HlyD family efflux transporter periplasmic adaptor subunit [Candidatus Omnitrophica bacterium]|nr:HlyD family efflux transporter periplasmic adaptor subunit [Candidatus Omnitrophota bacterium]